jgi:hypothetical protein
MHSVSISEILMNRLVLRAVALIAILVGVLSLFGIRPAPGRLVEMIIGTAALALGLALLPMTSRHRSTASSGTRARAA